MKLSKSGGFSLLEALISITVVVITIGGLAGMLIQNSRMNKKQQMTTQVQADARNCLSMIVQKLRNAGWDPRGIGFDRVTLDPDLSDGVSQIEVRADLNDDADIDDDFEALLIRHTAGRVEWRRSPAGSFETLAINITNDANGDGVIEPMFVPDADPPTRITVTITAASAAPVSQGGEFIRYTVSSDVVLRDSL